MKFVHKNRFTDHIHWECVNAMHVNKFLWFLMKINEYHYEHAVLQKSFYIALSYTFTFQI